MQDKEKHTRDEIIGKPPFAGEAPKIDKKEKWKREAAKRGLKTS